MAGVPLPGGLPGDPGGGGQEFLLLPDPDGAVLNHAGAAHNLPGAARQNNPTEKKQVFKVPTFCRITRITLNFGFFSYCIDDIQIQLVLKSWTSYFSENVTRVIY